MSNPTNPSSKEVELKECPRCQGTEFRVLGGGMNFWTVTCKCGLTSALCQTKEKVIEWWNTRASADSAGAMVDGSPILAFESWLLRWVADNRRKMTQDEYGIAYAAFIAAHPGEGPKAQVMSRSVVTSPAVPGDESKEP